MPLLKLVPDNTNIDFLRWRSVTFIVSALLVAGSIFFLAAKGLNFGVDFVGGQMVRVSFAQAPSLGELRDRVDALGLGDSTIQEAGSPRDISIRLPLPEGGEGAANEAGSEVRELVETDYPGATIESVDTVSGQVSNELVRAGALALLFAMIAISIYIWFRFEWQFGVGALISLLHDVLIVLGFLAFTQLEFDLNVVAALLTLIGYSLNDTIVIFDRVRENLRKYRKMEIEALLNLSVNETLSRTVATNLTMLLALGSLLFIGPEVIYSFTATLFVSVIIGTYSTTYVAAPILIWLKVTPDSFLPPEAGRGGAERVTPREADDGAKI
ncbi:MAG: protein translocase subunit SecF [Sphingomonadaceae bacterium]